MTLVAVVFASLVLLVSSCKKEQDKPIYNNKNITTVDAQFEAIVKIVIDRSEKQIEQLQKMDSIQRIAHKNKIDLLIKKGTSMSEKEYQDLVKLLTFSDIEDVNREVSELENLKLKIKTANIAPNQYKIKLNAALNNHFQTKRIVPSTEIDTEHPECAKIRRDFNLCIFDADMDFTHCVWGYNGSTNCQQSAWASWCYIQCTSIHRFRLGDCMDYYGHLMMVYLC